MEASLGKRQLSLMDIITIFLSIVFPRAPLSVPLLRISLRPRGTVSHAGSPVVSRCMGPTPVHVIASVWRTETAVMISAFIAQPNPMRL